MRGRGAPLAVWLLFAVDALAILVTYSRTPADQLYNVSGSGLAGGASRALVFLNFSTALAAIAVLLVAGRGLLAVVAGVLAAIVAWPGVVDQSNLDARWINVVPALGVALAAALTLRGDELPTAASTRGDRVRIVVVAVYSFLAIPWLAAELGFHFGAGIFLSGEPRAQAGLPGFPPAVHLGHHHGLDGLLLVATALLLSRVAPRRRLATVYLAALASYGLVNSAQDFWLEQVVKRGWTTWEIPSALQPSLSWIWLVIVWGAVALLPLLARG